MTDQSRPAQSSAPAEAARRLNGHPTEQEDGMPCHCRKCVVAAEHLEAYAALRTEKLEAQYQNQILIANDWKKIATSNSSTLGQQALLIDDLKARAETAESSLAQLRERWGAQLPTRLTINLNENCIETIKRLTPEGGEEISFGGLMGGVKLVWSGK